MENDWTLDPAIQSELSDKWYDQPDVVAGIKLNMQTLPFDPEGSGYDMESAKSVGMKPEIDPEDGLPHYGSVIETTKEQQKQYGLPEESYMLLKGKSHETWDKAVQGEAERGFRIKKFGDRYYSIPAEINEEGKDVEIDNQVRNKLYPGEDKYFKENPNVGGMMTEDNKVIINPYSNLTDNEKQAVIKNEKIRLNFKKNNIVPDIDITEEQRALFKGTPYENNEDAIKQTIVARIMTGDPSANATKEQTMVANKTLTQTLLKEKGYTSTAIAGIMANIDVETGGTFNFQEKQRGGKGYGVFQFDFLNPYYQKYLEKSEKKDSLESQIDFMHETVYGNEQDIIGKGNAKKLREGLENAKTPEEATEIFMNIFEKPGVPHLERRIESSKKFGGDLGINKANPITVTEEDVSD